MLAGVADGEGMPTESGFAGAIEAEGFPTFHTPILIQRLSVKITINSSAVPQTITFLSSPRFKVN